MKVLFLAALLATTGCDAWLRVDGRIVEAGAGGFTVLADPATNDGQDPPIPLATLRLMWEEEGVWKEHRMPSRILSDEEGCFAFEDFWIPPMGRPWDAILIEKKGFESVRIPVDSLKDTLGDENHLLIRMKRLP